MLAGLRVETPERAVVVAAEEHGPGEPGPPDRHQVEGAVRPGVIEPGVSPSGGPRLPRGDIELVDLVLGLVVEAAVLGGGGQRAVEAQEGGDRPVEDPVLGDRVPEQHVGAAFDPGGEGHRDQVADLTEPVEVGEPVVVLLRQGELGLLPGRDVDLDDVALADAGADVERIADLLEAPGIAVGGLDDPAVVAHLAGGQVVREGLRIRIGAAVEHVPVDPQGAGDGVAGGALDQELDLVADRVVAVHQGALAVPHREVGRPVRGHRGGAADRLRRQWKGSDQRAGVTVEHVEGDGVAVGEQVEQGDALVGDAGRRGAHIALHRDDPAVDDLGGQSEIGLRGVGRSDTDAVRGQSESQPGGADGAGAEQAAAGEAEVVGLRVHVIDSDAVGDQPVARP